MKNDRMITDKGVEEVVVDLSRHCPSIFMKEIKETQNG
jgi:hypothetical protein